MLTSDAGGRTVNEKHAAERTARKSAAGDSVAGAAREEERETQGGSQEVLRILALIV